MISVLTQQVYRKGVCGSGGWLVGNSGAPEYWRTFYYFPLQILGLFFLIKFMEKYRVEIGEGAVVGTLGTIEKCGL